MRVITVLLVTILINKSCSQVLSLSPTCFSSGETLTLQCDTTDLSLGIKFYHNGISQGGCLSNVPPICGSGITQSGTTTSLVISQFTDATNSGNWSCEYGSSSSPDIIITVNPCSSGGGGNGSNYPWWIVFIFLGIFIIITVCFLFNTRCRFRYLLANCACTCPKKDTIVIRKNLSEERVSRSIGDNIEIQFLNGKDGKFGDVPCAKKFLKKPCILFNPYIEIHELEKSNAGIYTMTKDNDRWQLELTVTEETKSKDNSRIGKPSISASKPRQNARKTLDPLVNGEDGNVADGPK